MSCPSPAPLLVLHAVRLKGRAGADAVALATGLAADAVDRTLGELAGEGLVARREGAVPGWAVTPEGRTAHCRWLEEEVAGSGRRADVEAAYRIFLGINGELLATCTAWQLRELDGGETVLNDHRDPGYDGEVLGRMRALHERAVPVCDDLAAALARFGRYAPRLSGALARVEAGEPEWLTRPLIDSYHSVWFELHEDLLVTLGLERKKGA